MTVIVRGGSPRVSRAEREQLVLADIEQYPGDDDGTRAERLAGSLALSPVTAGKVVKQVKLRLGLAEPATRKRRGTEHQGTSRSGQLMTLAGWHPYQWRLCCWTGQVMEIDEGENEGSYSRLGPGGADYRLRLGNGGEREAQHHSGPAERDRTSTAAV